MKPKRYTVKREKLTEYLLNPDHPQGRAKAKFFLSKGFSRENPKALEPSLKRHVREAKPCKIQRGAEGEGFKVSYIGPLRTPKETVERFISVWYVDEEGTATLITAYPAGERDRCHENKGT